MEHDFSWKQSRAQAREQRFRGGMVYGQYWKSCVIQHVEGNKIRLSSSRESKTRKFTNAEQSHSVAYFHGMSFQGGLAILFSMEAEEGRVEPFEIILKKI